MIEKSSHSSLQGIIQADPCGQISEMAVSLNVSAAALYPGSALAEGIPSPSRRIA